MNPFLRIVLATLAGFVVFAATAVGVTELFTPRIEFSLFVGLPVAIWAAIATVLVTAVGLWYRDERADGPVSGSKRGIAWAAGVVAVDVVAVAGIGIAWYFLIGGSVALGLLIYGIPLTMVVAALVGYLASGFAGGENGDRGLTAQ